MKKKLILGLGIPALVALCAIAVVGGLYYIDIRHQVLKRNMSYMFILTMTCQGLKIRYAAEPVL